MLSYMISYMVSLLRNVQQEQKLRVCIHEYTVLTQLITVVILNICRDGAWLSSSVKWLTRNLGFPSSSLLLKGGPKDHHAIDLLT